MAPHPLDSPVRPSLAGVKAPPPAGRAVEIMAEGVQMTGDAVAGAPDPGAVPLGPADVPEMLGLAGRTTLLT